MFNFLPSGMLNALQGVGVGGVSPPNSTVRFATHNERMASERVALTGNNAWCWRIGKPMCYDAYDIQFAFHNFWFDWTGNVNLGTQQNTGNAYTIGELSLTAPNGVTVPLTFSGGRSMVMANGTAKTLTDKIYPGAFGYTTFPAGMYYIKGMGTVPAVGNYIPASSQFDASHIAGCAFRFYNTANTTITSTDVDGMYTVATGAALTSTFRGVFPVMLNTPVVDGDSFIGVGDSILQGAQENASPGTAGRGFGSRAFYNNGVNSVPFMNMGIASAVTQMFSVSSQLKWREYIMYAKDALDEMNTNSVDRAYLFADVMTHSRNLWAVFRANGIRRIYKTELLCKTTSTDNWATLANQTSIASGWAAGELAEQLNIAMLAEVGQPTGIYKLVGMSGMKDPTDPYRWASTGASRGVAYDGLHPSTAGHTLMGTIFRSGVDLVNP